jgi:heme-degrading monooxygenase HmoA
VRNVEASGESGCAQPVVTVFRSRLREEHEREYSDMAARMVELAASIPGFVEIKSFTADDGERVSIVTFESIEAHKAWRDHPEHRAAQAAGRERFYSEYQIWVCEAPAERAFKA